MASEEGNSGRPGLAGTALRRAPIPPGGGGLPGARLAQRSRGCRARSLAAAQPRRPRRRAQSRRMAHHRGGPGVPGHAPLPRRAPRRAARRARAGARHGPGRRGRIRTGGPDGRVGRPGATRGARQALRPSGSRSCSTTCSPSPSWRSPRYWGVPRTPRRCWPAAPGGGCRQPTRCPAPTSPARPSWSGPSSPPPATVTSPHCSRNSTPASSSAPNPPPSGPVPCQRFAAHLPLRGNSPNVP